MRCKIQLAASSFAPRRTGEAPFAVLTDVDHILPLPPVPARRASVVRRAEDRALQTLMEENELLRRTIEAAGASVAEVEMEIKKLGFEVYAPACSDETVLFLII